ncbi:TPR repeat precursor (plasmid) [Paraburkholderia caribensis MBA4]|uniref:TPR repeat n=2 Tax=Paraburkholderia caribensis TaxID=75105 RepID=A0A0P0RN59_9BURK|nr:TPR repeat precursor [Paraburkholderia caribensis MBA4]
MLAGIECSSEPAGNRSRSPYCGRWALFDPKQPFRLSESGRSTQQGLWRSSSNSSIRSFWPISEVDRFDGVRMSIARRCLSALAAFLAFNVAYAMSSENAASPDFPHSASAFEPAVSIGSRDNNALAPNANGTHERAQRYFRQALKDLRAGRFADAVRGYDAVLSIEPNRFALVDRGIAKQQLADYDAAIDDYSRAIGIDPDDAIALMNRGYARLHKEQFELAIADFTRSVQLNPRLSVTYTGRAFAYRNTKQYVAALADYDSAEATEPLPPNDQVERGIVLAELHRFSEAIERYNTVLTQNPNNYRALIYRAFAFEKQNQVDLAIRDYTTALVVSSDRELTHRMRGIAFDKAGRYDEAIADFSEAIRMTPQSARPYVLRARTYRHARQYAQAFEDLATAQRLDPVNLDVYWDRAELWEQAGNFAEAIDDYTRIIRIHPLEVDAWMFRADNLTIVGRYDDALSDFDTAQRLDPTSPYLLLGKARFFFYRGRWAESKADLEVWLRRLRAGEFEADGSQQYYAVIWRHLAAMKARLDDQTDFANDAAVLDHAKWPWPIIAFYSGKLSAPQLLASADGAAEGDRKRRLCEANTYLGEANLSRGDNEAATKAFESAVNNCPPGDIEKALATYELKQRHASAPRP